MQAAQTTRKELEERKEAYKKLKKQCQKQKQWIAEYQLLMRAGASGQHKVQYFYPTQNLLTDTPLFI